MDLARRLVFPEPKRVVLEDFELTPPADDEVRVRCLYSLMSTGTENIALNQAFSPGTHWAAWVRYPFTPGYASVGEVEGTGELVFVGLPHASHFNIATTKLRRVSAGVDGKQAAWNALAGIAFVGARNAQYKLGDRVLIIGAGPVGQMSVRWARAAGAASIIVVDEFAGRLKLAEAGGGTAVIKGRAGAHRDAIKEASGGSLPNIVVDCTGHASAFAEALTVVGWRGRVVLVGDAGSPEEQHLTPDVITRGITIVGTHGRHLPDVIGAGPDEAQAEFDRSWFALVARGQFSLDGLISHEFSPEDCADAYALANARRGDTMGILFNWTASR